MGLFRSGSVALAQGAVDGTLANLSLPFTPTQVVVSVRQPVADSPLISAFVVGTPTASGFSYTLSATVPGTGYILDWCAVADSMVQTDGDSLAVDYTQLVAAVADFLGYDPANLTEDQTAKVNGYIRSGLRQFYYPPKMEGIDENFEWSFLRMDGSVQTAANVGSYLMADGFGRVAGTLYFGGDDIQKRPIPIASVADVLNAQRRGERGIPRLAAVRFADSTYGEHGQRMELLLAPVPDREYVLTFDCEADTGMLDATSRPYPLGGARFSELVVESCLAIAEQRANDETGQHTEKFKELLISNIARDRKSSATVFGQMGDRPDIPPPSGRPINSPGGFKITYHGHTW